jgi:hypothetical protein
MALVTAYLTKILGTQAQFLLGIIKMGLKY